jgi:hypothetical protein
MLLFFICLFFLLLINFIFLLYRRTVCDRWILSVRQFANVFD